MMPSSQKSFQSRGRASLAVLGLCGLILAGCATEGADYVLSLPEATQRQAFAECMAGGPTVTLQRLVLNDGRVSVFAADGNGVSLTQARSLNQCARARLLSGQSTAAAPQATSYAPQPQTARASVQTSGCVPGLGVMQRANLYCVGY